jgi:RNA polymerase sigma-70 factor (ECF subfamily)
VVRAYHAYVWKVALRVTGHEEDAADVSQDVFLRLLLDPPGPSQVRSPGGYLAWCVVGRASQLRRSAARRLERERLWEEEHTRRAGESGPPLEDIDSLRAVVAKLPDDLRVPVELRYLAGLSNKEISETLELPPRTLEQRLQSARDQLKRSLTPLALGVALSGEPTGENVPPPPGLLSGLLRIANQGEAIAPKAAGSAATGGAIVAALHGKGAALLGAVACVLVGIAAVSFREWDVARPSASQVHATSASRTSATSAVGSEESPLVSTESSAPEQAALPAEPPRARLRGIVRDDDSKPMAGVKVIFHDNVPAEDAIALTAAGYRGVKETNWILETTTGEKGEYAFSELLPDKAWVEAKADGMDGDGGELDLSAGNETWQELTLHPLGRLTGHILDAAGRALPGGALLVRTACVKGSMPTLGDMSTHFAIFPANATGRYDTGPCLRLHPGPGPSEEALAWADGYAAKPPIFQGSEWTGHTAVLDFELEAEIPLTLLVTDALLVPIEGVQVGHGDASSVYGWYPYPLCHTGPDGKARVEHLSRATRKLRIAKEGFLATAFAFEPDGPAELHVTLMPLGAAIEARVIFDEAIPVGARHGFDISLERQGADGMFRGAEAEQNAPGDSMHRSFVPREPGRFRILFRDQGEDLYAEPFDYTGREPVHVDLPVRLKPPMVAGRVVRGESREPVSGVSVTAYYHKQGNEPLRWNDGTFLRNVHFPRPARSRRTSETDADGRFFFLLPPGECPLDIRLRAGDAKLGWAEDAKLDLAATATRTDLELELREGGAIEGQAIAEDGGPAVSELIAAYDGGDVEWKITDAEGRFRFDGLRPARYAVEALGRVTVVRVASGSRGGDMGEGLPPPEEVFERRVAVEAGKTTSWRVRLPEDRLGSIEGRISNELPQKGEVACSMIIGGEPRHTGVHSQEVVAEDGRFRIENLHAGLYQIEFMSGDAKAEAQVVVVRGRIGRITLQEARKQE